MTMKGSEELTAADIIRQINARNAKIIATLAVLGFIFYHGILHVRYGIDSCKWLLSDGRYKGDMEWQPYGCMMHRYSLKDTHRCFRYLSFLGRRNHFVFIGDTHVQLYYHTFLHHLASFKGSESSLNELNLNKTLGTLKKNDLKYNDSLLGLFVEYLWCPYLSDSMIDHFRKLMDFDSPSVVVVGMSSPVVKKSWDSAEILKQFTANLTRFAMALPPKSSHHVRVLWVPVPSVQEEKNSHRNHNHKQLLNQKIDMYNKAAFEVLEHSGAQVWWSSKLLAEGRLDESSGVFPGLHALSEDTQILLNAYCNDHMNFNDGTCCWSAEPYTFLQILTYSFFAVCIAIASAMCLFRFFQKYSRNSSAGYAPIPLKVDLCVNATTTTTITNNNLDAFTLFFNLSKFGLIMTFFYLCDRTSFFMKENKYYSALSFWLPLSYMVVLGLFFTEESRYTKVLHREQTDEWKGWMQLAILIYHMTDASGVLPIYMHIRVLISSYLFLTGYGHFCYFWQRGEGGIVRFFQVLFRLNLLTVVLCLAMNRPYQFYNFIPLVSWWVFAIFLLLSLPPRVTAASSDGNPLQFLYLVLKFVGFISIFTILYMSEVFFEKVFVTRPWKALFVTTDDDIHDWWFRWKQDRYSVSYGMMYAVVLFVAQRHQLLDDRNHSNLLSPRMSLFAVLAALSGLGGYLGFSLLCRNRQECNEVHPYIVFIPILSYIALRNISGVLRTRFSTFFAWFGRISLELSVCQYHIWLAADSNGVLVLVPGYPALNAIITSFIFVCVSHEVHEITVTLTPYAVPSDWRKVLRNAALFTLILIPIGIHDGMF